MNLDESQKLEFLQKEYQEAAKAFAVGVQVGQDAMRSYLTGTTILAALIGAAWGAAKDKTYFAEYASLPISTIGIIGSLLAIFILNHYERHLDGCRDRCVQIESQFDGKTFTNIKQVSESVRFNAVFVFKAICGLFASLWVLLAIVVIVRLF